MNEPSRLAPDPAQEAGPAQAGRGAPEVDAMRGRQDHRARMSLLSTYRNALPAGAPVLWYRIERVLGQGAFGITYLAHDDNLQRAVAIKEYLPGHLARREADDTIHPLTAQLSEEYGTGLHRFLSEARTLARFEHPNIVRVHNVFEHNRTAYMVMQYEEGEGLDRLLRERGRLDEAQLLAWLPGLLDGLETIHLQGYVHRDIKPANVLVRTNGDAVLLDFGSARHATPEEVKTLTNFVSPGYAPIEQYAGKSDQQGPWTDIYGLGATLYRAMAGHAPPDAVERSHALAQRESDTYQPDQLAYRELYTEDFVAAVDHALCFRMQDRPQTITEWRAEFPLSTSTSATAPPARESRVHRPQPAAADIPTRPSPTRDLPAPLVTASRPVSAQRSSLVAGAGFLFALLIGIGAIARLAPTSASKVATTAPAPAAAARAPASKAPPRAPAPTAPVRKPTSAPSAVPEPLAVDNAALTLAARVDDLLARAAADVEATRYTQPAGDNAYEKYRDVLTLDPTNETARDGIAALAHRYLELAQHDIDSGLLERADGYLRRAEALAPAQLATIAAREALSRKLTGPAVPGTRPRAAAAPAAPAPEAAAETTLEGWRAPIEDRAPPPR